MNNIYLVLAALVAVPVALLLKGKKQGGEAAVSRREVEKDLPPRQLLSSPLPRCLRDP